MALATGVIAFKIPGRFGIIILFVGFPALYLLGMFAVNSIMDRGLQRYDVVPAAAYLVYYVPAYYVLATFALLVKILRSKE